jgi:hypothetical protein
MRPVSSILEDGHDTRCCSAGTALPSQQAAEQHYLQPEVLCWQYRSHDFMLPSFLHASTHFSIEHAFARGSAAETPLAVVPISVSTAIKAEIRNMSGLK